MVFKQAWELRDKNQISVENRVFLTPQWMEFEEHEESRKNSMRKIVLYFTTVVEYLLKNLILQHMVIS